MTYFILMTDKLELDVYHEFNLGVWHFVVIVKFRQGGSPVLSVS